jgi:hypothetical protein
LAPMCPSTSFWQEKIAEIVATLARDYGVSGVYLDQMCAAEPALCFDESHGHPAGGGEYWSEGYRKLMERVRTETAKANLGAFFTSECNAECWNDLVDGLLTWEPAAEDMVPAYAAVYGGYVQCFGRAVQQDQLSGDGVYINFAQQFLWGSQLGWVEMDFPTRTESQPAAEFLRSLARRRSTLHDYLVKGRMLRPPVLRTDVPSIAVMLDGKHWSVIGTREINLPIVQTAAWRAPDDSVVIILVNSGAEDIRVAYGADLKEAGLSGKTLTLSELDSDGNVLHVPRVLATTSLEEEVTLSARSIYVVRIAEVKD